MRYRMCIVNFKLLTLIYCNILRSDSDSQGEVVIDIVFRYIIHAQNIIAQQDIEKSTHGLPIFPACREICNVHRLKYDLFECLNSSKMPKKY